MIPELADVWGKEEETRRPEPDLGVGFVKLRWPRTSQIPG